MSITLEHSLGEGFYGALHRARDGELPFLIELLTHASSAGDIADRLARTTTLDLPGALKVIQVVTLSEGPGVLYENFAGKPLSVLLASRPSARAVVEIISQIAGTLHAAWAQPFDGGSPLGLVHGALDLRRIWIDRTGRVKLEGLGQEPGGLVAGTCRAPEHSASHDGDVFTLGWLLAWALLGERPELNLNDGELNGSVSILAVRVREHTGDERLAALLEDMLRFSPSARPPAAMLIPSLEGIASRMSGASLAEWAVSIPAPKPPKKKKKSRLFGSFSSPDPLLDDLELALPPVSRTVRATAPVVARKSVPEVSAPPVAEPAVEEPAVEEPAVEEPAVVEPSVEPVAAEPVAAPKEAPALVMPEVQSVKSSPRSRLFAPPSASELPFNRPPPVLPPPRVPTPAQSVVAEAPADPPAPTTPRVKVAPPMDVDLPIEPPPTGEAPPAIEPPAIEPPSAVAEPEAAAPSDVVADESAVEELDLDQTLPKKVDWSLDDSDNIDSPEDWETSPVSSGVMTNPLASPKNLSPEIPDDDTDEVPRESTAEEELRLGIVPEQTADEVIESRFFDSKAAAPVPVRAAKPLPEAQERSWGMLFLLMIPALLLLGWILTRSDETTEPTPEPAPVDVPGDLEVPEVPEAPEEPPAEAPEPVEEPAATPPAAPVTPPPAPVQPVAVVPVVEPAPQPVRPPEPPPVEEPPPEVVEAPPDNGKFLVTGDASSVTLQRSGRSYGSGSLPEGRYEIMVSFTDGDAPISSGSVMIEAGAQAEVDCSAAFMRCRVR